MTSSHISGPEFGRVSQAPEERADVHQTCRRTVADVRQLSHISLLSEEQPEGPDALPYGVSRHQAGLGDGL